MRAFQSYFAKVSGCGKKPVKFKVKERLAQGEFSPKKGMPRKAELALTEDGMLVGRKVVYKDFLGGSKKVEEYKKFNSIVSAKKWFSPAKREELAILAVIKTSLSEVTA